MTQIVTTNNIIYKIYNFYTYSTLSTCRYPSHQQSWQLIVFGRQVNEKITKKAQIKWKTDFAKLSKSRNRGEVKWKYTASCTVETQVLIYNI